MSLRFIQIKYSIILIILISIISSCKYSNENEDQNIFYLCDAENVTKDNKYFIDKNNSKIKFSNAGIQSSEKVFSGQYSVKLDSLHKFGMSVKIKGIKPEQKYKISVVRYGNPKSFIIASTGKNFYEKIGDNTKQTEKPGWYLLEKIIQIPYYSKSNELNIYLWNSTNETAYFDMLRIEQLPTYQEYNFTQEPLYIYIDEPDLQKLEEIRKKAFQKGILETTDDSWVKASMFYKDEDFNTELRFKGDWLDHLEGIKWSFRIKIKKEKTWKGMKTFSIQNPESRHFLDEWFAHKILESEDVLTTKYDFVPVFLNNKPLGLYAYEEHFEKHLVESKQRREGVILRFSEDQFWATYNAAKTTDTMPVYEASDIIPFKRLKTVEDTNIFKQFLVAQNLLYTYKYQLKKPAEIFDINQLAKYYAAVSLTKMNHSLRWHNQRFYYNPIISKLEIIAFDGYAPKGIMPWGGNIFGNFEINTAENSKIENISNYYIFTDSVFVQEYIKQLEIFSSEKFVNQSFSKNRKQLEKLENEIQKEYIDYKFDTSFIYNNAKKIRKDLDIYKIRVKKGKYKNIKFKRTDILRYSKKYYKNLVPLFINAYTEYNDNNEKLIKIENYLPFNISVTGFSETDLFISEKTGPITINKFINLSSYKKIKTEFEQTNYVCCRIPNINYTFFIEIFPWNSPGTETPLQSLQKDKTTANTYYTISEDIIIFKKGKHKINSTIIIPPEHKVIIEAGTELDFIEHAAFISYSEIQMNGNANNKVIIKSSDNSGQGFTVLQAIGKSVVKHVIFDGFNTLNHQGWTLTGAVNFYKSDVKIEHTIFKNNVCEDALNIINSDFIVQNCSFENISSDAFDSDFCTGELSGTNFSDTGNDAIDFSGSTVQISDCKIINAGDKGISGGENSILYVSNCSVSNSKIAVASKDKSTVNLSDCSIKDCHYGLVAFQKKPEFGPAMIKADNLNHSNLINLHLIEKKSDLILNLKKIIGDKNNLAKQLY